MTLEFLIRLSLLHNQGYNGSQLWDVTFAVQAILSTGLVNEYGTMLRKANNFIKSTQVIESHYIEIDDKHERSCIIE